MNSAGLQLAVRAALILLVAAPALVTSALLSSTPAEGVAYGLLFVASTALFFSLPTLRWTAWVSALLAPLAIFWVGFAWLLGDAPHISTLHVLWSTPLPEVLTWLEGRRSLVAAAIALSGLPVGLALVMQKLTEASDYSRSARRACLAIGLSCVAVVFVWHFLAQALARQQDDAVEIAARSAWPSGVFRAGFDLAAGLFDPSRSEGKSAVTDPARPLPFVPRIADGAQAGMLVVFVIGESHRADVLSPTTRPDLAPGLRKLADAGQLVEFTDVVSASNLTTYSVPAMLTGTSSAQLLSGVHGKPSGLGYFKGAGFFAAWISNQADDLFNELGWDVASYPSSDRYVAHDEVLLSKLRQLLGLGHAHKSFVLHMMGSHFDYERRYPASFRSLPAANVPRPAYVRQNYENSVAYSADVLDRILLASLAVPEPAVVIFSSDHGENLMDDERGLIWHGGTIPPSRYEFSSATWIAWNKAWADAFPHLVTRLREIAHEPLSHEHLLGIWLTTGGLLGHDGRPIASIMNGALHELPRPGDRTVFFVGKSARFADLR
jgi:glucan phosphoethanolaminetransferase (alkaline phosphatase superfamily)